MKYVYLLQSEDDPNRHYVGSTLNMEKRFKDHNNGLSAHTRKFTPWKLIVSVAFSDHAKADQFEAYLKTGSGRAFAKRHF